MEVSHVWHRHFIKDDTSRRRVGELGTELLLCHSIFIIARAGASVDREVDDFRVKIWVFGSYSGNLDHFLESLNFLLR